MKKRGLNIKKFLFYLVLIVVSIIVGVILAKRDSVTTSKNNVFQNKKVDDKRIDISGVKVNDFLQDNRDTNFITVSQTKDYHIFYIPDQEIFTISITSYPFDEHIKVAEQDFLDKLGIGKEDACKLNVDVTTPRYANPDKAGEVYKLSFCEN